MCTGEEKEATRGQNFAKCHFHAEHMRGGGSKIGCRSSGVLLSCLCMCREQNGNMSVSLPVAMMKNK